MLEAFTEHVMYNEPSKVMLIVSKMDKVDVKQIRTVVT